MLRSARAFGALLAIFFSTAIAGFAQTFVAEWNAADQGGVGPTGLVLSTEGGVTYLYASDQPRGRVIKFNTTTGAIAGVFGKQGNANGDFNSPYGLARDSASGDIYVAERGNHRISRITSGGAFVMAWGTPGSGAGQFTEPVGVGVDSAGDVYVTDHGNHRVQKFHLTQTGGTWNAASVAAWGSQGSGNGQFNLPYGITIDAAGSVWVADGFNGRVQRFNTAGVYQATLGSAGTAGGQFVVATWVGLHPGGDLLVTSTNSNPQDGTLADANNQWISRFTAAGSFVSRWGGTFGSGAGQFRLPFSAVVDSANRAYVSDYYNTRIQIFDLNTPPGGGGTTGGGTTGGGTSGGTDTTPPTVAGFTAGVATATSVSYQLTLSEAVSGVNATDFTAVTTGGAATTIGTVSGSGATYSIPVTFSGTGTIRLDLNGSGTGIADAAGNAIVGGASSAVFTIPTPTTGGGTGGGVSTVHITNIAPPANRTYDKGDEVTFVVRFSGNVTVNTSDDQNKGGSGNAGPGNKGGEDDDDDDASLWFAWTAAAPGGLPGSSGRVTYRSGSGTNALTFRYKVRNGDMAPSGILLGTVLQIDRGVVIRDAAGVALASTSLALPWTQNPLVGVIFNAPKPKDAGSPGNKGKAERLINLSSRLRVTGGDASRSVVAGFVVSGSAPKPILIRAVGPGLAGFGIRDGVPDPRIQLRDSTGKLIGENSGWNDRLEITVAGDKVGAFRLGHGSRDAALLVALPPGAYTAQVFANGNGLVLVEVYDGSTGTELATEQIVNISTRGFVGTGDDVLVAGFVVTGNAPKRVLIRGVGPTLGTFGVTGALADPVLRLYRAGTAAALAQNDNWQTPQPVSATQVPATAAEISAATTLAGAFPLGAASKDAVIIVSLASGNYSAVVSGANNSTGAGLVEIYELP